MPEVHPEYVRVHRRKLVELLTELRRTALVLAPEESKEQFPTSDRVNRIMAIFHEVIDATISMPKYDIRSVTDEGKGELLVKIWRIASGQE